MGMPLLQSGVVGSTHASCVRSRRPCVSIGIRRVIDASCIRDILGQGTGNTSRSMKSGDSSLPSV